MKAMIVDQSTPERRLLWDTVPEPELGATDILIEVKAAGVNRADLRRAVAHFAATDSGRASVAGLEVAGVVLQVGGSTSGFAPGDRVMAMASNAFAERAAIDYRFALRVPAGLSWQEAASVPVSFITAHNALVTSGQFRTGETVLVQAASSGVGIATVQIAAFKGATTIFGTGGAPDKLSRLRELGCHVPINYRVEDTAEIVRRETASSGVDVTVDLAGGATLTHSIAAAAVHGRIVCAGRVAGTDVGFNIDEFSRKQLVMTGVTNRTRTMDERVEVVRAFAADLLPALEAGALKPVIDRTFDLRDAEVAFTYMNSNQHFGKIVLRA